MQNYHMFLFLLLSFLLVAVSHSTHARTVDPKFDEGVSKELADYRKEHYKNPTYSLRFTIPSVKALPVLGELAASFRLDYPRPIIFDFRENSNAVHKVRVNGRPVSDFRLKNEHIVIPSKYAWEGENQVEIEFTAGNQSLNRNQDYLYTLLVPDRARTLFPCFDQPNMKANYTLQLDLPADWSAVSNTYVESETIHGMRKTVKFVPTEPLSTYLFSFVAGRLQKVDYQDARHRFSAYHRETDSTKIAQLDEIFRLVASSLDWMEAYTGVPYPFAKYDLIILPGFQYGGMEHTGATLYNDTRMFLNTHATPDEILARTELIAHETCHMWFGDYVTMDWFDDVWTKEVFANYFAACIAEPLFPEINHRLNWMKTYTAAAQSEDRTDGTTPIRQPLDNLRNAGLVYGQIIYNKAPVMMKKLVELMGEEMFQVGIREYLGKYGYSNASWGDLIKILDALTQCDLSSFSEVWVNEKGRPEIHFDIVDDSLVVSQKDKYGRGLVWPQRFQVSFIGNRSVVREINLNSRQVSLKLPEGTRFVLPNTDGRGYGLFVPDTQTLDYLLKNVDKCEDDTERLSLYMVLYENYLAGNIPDERWANTIFCDLEKESNELLASVLTGYLSNVMGNRHLDNRSSWEIKINHLRTAHPLASCRLQLLRLLISNAESKSMVDVLFTMWKNESEEMLSERDYTSLSYELALRMPDSCDSILQIQRERITNPDRLRQFDYVSRAVSADKASRDALFQEMLKAENRRIEPWTASALGYLNHPLREAESISYIRPALEVLMDVQRTGDIFFPSNWCRALLAGHRSAPAAHEVRSFLMNHPEYPDKIRNKILQASYLLLRQNNEN